jgi:hypothetical protein
MSTNMFERASRMGLRFDSPKGELTVEQLWTLPLSSEIQGKLSLDLLGQNVMQKLATSTAATFLESAPNPERSRDELRLDILKHIRDVKQAESKAARDQANKRAERERLLEILEQKKLGQLSELSVEDLESRIAALSV